jgi:tRNA threonylcarbamoyladenosine biosynthesis protein TsaE
VTSAPVVAHTSSPDATRELAAALAPVLAPGDILLLVGDLGTGKTTFTQGLARGLGVTDPVTSPTFTLLRAYRCGTGPVRTLLHADLYRLDHLKDVVDLGIPEMVDDESVAVVEWGDVAASVFGPDLLSVHLGPDPGPTPDAIAEQQRMVTIRPQGTWSPRLGAVAGALSPWTTRPVPEGPGRPRGS